MTASLPAETWVLCSERMPPVGRKVLAFFKNELGRGRRVLARFVPARTDCADNYDYWNNVDDDWFDTDESGTSWIPEGWYEESETQENCPMICCPVTHWMQLPEAPIHV